MSSRTDQCRCGAAKAAKAKQCWGCELEARSMRGWGKHIRPEPVCKTWATELSNQMLRAKL